MENKVKLNYYDYFDNKKSQTKLNSLRQIDWLRTNVTSRKEQISVYICTIGKLPRGYGYKGKRLNRVHPSLLAFFLKEIWISTLNIPKFLPSARTEALRPTNDFLSLYPSYTEVDLNLPRKRCPANSWKTLFSSYHFPFLRTYQRDNYIIQIVAYLKNICTLSQWRIDNYSVILIRSIFRSRMRTILLIVRYELYTYMRSCLKSTLSYWLSILLYLCYLCSSRTWIYIKIPWTCGALLMFMQH